MSLLESLMWFWVKKAMLRRKDEKKHSAVVVHRRVHVKYLKSLSTFSADDVVTRDDASVRSQYVERGFFSGQRHGSSQK